MENMFDILRDGLSAKGINPRSKASQDWLAQKVAGLSGGINRDNLMRNEPVIPTARPLPGRMYMFHYDPKTSATIEYYDAFPLVMLVDMSSRGFEGLNLHYLPIDLRQKLFYSLLSDATNKSYDQNVYLKITYDKLKSARKYKGFKPCYKKYLTNRIKGNMVNVPASEWEIAVHLPTASFNKASEAKVHSDSRKMVARF